ncbi:beta-phosphoglucomutase family hydrolase [Lipingzhangella sp. LS1_29]|uniref:Beta-phosphoglucomutase n=1 Tax=Lipingzhangella rawalii TaxID=2055835 RepID=A0ABU2HAU0_9ACTN|nr:beta-phosphoglucomutase family hydrolase [Lipingzhangella rawalii]MDS1272373.1 beta-phosphoglucomutase family hydrolase [Lipingzhangella rawalii]
MRSIDDCVGVILDTDGVITNTAGLHAAAWKHAIDEFLLERAHHGHGRFRPFDMQADYLRYVDGRSRGDGVRTFLASRSITLPETAPPQDPGAVTVSGLGDRKDRYFLQQVQEYGVAPFASTIAFVRRLRERGVALAAASASRNCKTVLRAAGVADLFEVRVDGWDVLRLGLAGKPAPDLFLEAARRLGVPAQECAVVEDATAGVEAARRGEFGLVVGIDRGGWGAELYRHGADIVVTDLSGTALAAAPSRDVS